MVVSLSPNYEQPFCSHAWSNTAVLYFYTEDSVPVLLLTWAAIYSEPFLSCQMDCEESRRKKKVVGEMNTREENVRKETAKQTSDRETQKTEKDAKRELQ